MPTASYLTLLEEGQLEARVEEAGGRAHREYWIPAEDLTSFNAAIVGLITVTQRFP